MSTIPSDQGPITKADLNAAIRTAIEEIAGRMERVESSLSARMERVESGLSARMERVESDLTARIERVESDLSARMERVETNLLTEFHKWASPVEMRLRSHGAAIRAVDLQQEAVTDSIGKLVARLDELERRADERNRL
ncbi:MAG TPA: hypothetical protein VHW24_12005 [Bryobacteraceae bacterium]|jgi:hypothetical protein|nr:hypothetical protein [Bryobacteraceae bacterium]